MSRYLWRGGRYSSSTTQPYGRITTVITPLLSLTLLFYVVSFQLLHFTFVRATNNGEPMALTGTLTPLLTQSHLLRHADPQQRLMLSLGLRPGNTDALTHALQQLDHSKQVGTIERFSPTQGNYTRVAHYLKDAGFTITRTYPHRFFINFQGTVAQVEALFRTPINLYSTPDKQPFYANSQEPWLPDWLHALVSGLYGLNNATHWQHTATQDLTAPSKGSPATALSHNCPQANGHTLVPQQLASAYGLDALYQQGYRGEGQDIALFELANIQPGDIATYATCFGISTSSVLTRTNAGSSQTIGTDTRASESDVELLLSAVPHLHSLSVYETDNNESSYLSQWASILADRVPIVATGWNICEQQAASAFLQQEHLFFALAALQGQNILAASGSNACQPSATTAAQAGSPTVTDPAAQPYAISVGGSSLTLNGTAYSYETAWTPTTAATSKTAGAATTQSDDHSSRYWPRPAWQHMVGIAQPLAGTANDRCQGSSCRTVPDVAFNADPATGYWIYCSVAAAGCTPAQPWQSIGGTATAAIYWSALLALTNQLAQQQGSGQIGFSAPLLYQIANDPVAYAHCFHDIVIGAATTGSPLLNNIGYDTATGLGSYRTWNLAHALVQKASTGTDTHNQVQLDQSR
jgi:Predicted protease